MQVSRDGMVLTITKEKQDPRFRDGEWGSGESRLLYHIKKKIIAGEVENWGGLPTDIIKKRMWKDGHLVDDGQLYLRSREYHCRTTIGGNLYLTIHNTHWAIRGIDTDFNEDGVCHLQVSFCTITDREVGKRSSY